MIDRRIARSWPFSRLESIVFVILVLAAGKIGEAFGFLIGLAVAVAFGGAGFLFRRMRHH
jgi:hypothetical protein